MPSGARALCDACLPPTVERTMGEIRDRLTELAREEVERCADRGPYGVPCMLPAGHADLHSSEATERCSCDESLALRDRLAIATRGMVALHVVKEDGYWTVERWRDGELVESYVGVPTVAEALERIGEWMTTKQGETQCP